MLTAYNLIFFIIIKAFKIEIILSFSMKYIFKITIIINYKYLLFLINALIDLLLSLFDTIPVAFPTFGDKINGGRGAYQCKLKLGTITIFFTVSYATATCSILCRYKYKMVCVELIKTIV